MKTILLFGYKTMAVTLLLIAVPLRIGGRVSDTLEECVKELTHFIQTKL